MSIDANYKLRMQTQGMGKATQQVKGLNRSLGSLAKGAMATAGAFLGARALYGGLKTTLDLFGREEMAVKKLTASLGKNSPALEAQARALQRVTMFGNEAIMEAQALIGAFVKDEEAIKKATIATLDLASAKGMDLVTSADLVSKTLGSSTNAMSRYGIEVVGAVGSTERLDSLTNNIANTFGGQASAMADTFSGSVEQLGNLLGDVGESIGGFVAPAIQSLVEAMSDLIETSAVDELNNEKDAMDDLFAILNDSNISYDLRKKTIDEINSKYGAYIPNMLSEKSTLDDIKKAHKQIRSEMIKNMAIEINKEKIQKTLGQHLDLIDEEKRMTKELGGLKIKETEAYARHKEAQDKVNDAQIAGLETSSRYKDAGDNLMETAMLLGEATSYSTIEIENATSAVYEHTIALEQNRIKQQELKDLVIELQDEAGDLADEYVAGEKKKVDATTATLKWKEMVSKKDAKMIAMQAQDAKSGAINVIKAEVSEAMAGYISSVLKSVPYPWNLILAGMAGGVVNSLMDQAISKLAEGSDQVVTKPTIFMAGEAGAERVSVTNLTKSDGGINSPNAGGSIVINAEVATEDFMDRVMEYIDEKRDLNLA